MQLLIMKDDRPPHYKGDIVEVRASGTPFGGREPEAFVLVEVPDVPMTAYEHYNNAWERIIDFSIVAQDAAQDGYRIRLFSTLTAGELGVITKDHVEAFIASWGGSVYSWASNEVVFDIRIYDALVSTAFWEIDISNVVFSELSYDQGTGIHRIQANYNALGNNPTYIERYVRGKNLNIISHADKVLVYDADRNIVRDHFQNDIKEKSKSTIVRRRYYVNPGVVDFIIPQGGRITTDEATMLSYLRDKVTD